MKKAKYSYLVLGTGVGKAIAYLLATLEDTKEVFVSDEALLKAMWCADRVNELTGTKKCHGIEFHIGDSLNQQLFASKDVVISALPAKYNCDLATLAIKTKTHFCDLGGVVEVTRNMM